MPVTVNSHSIPIFDDTKDIPPKPEWDAIQTTLTAFAGAIDTDSKLTDGIVFAGDLDLTAADTDIDLKDNSANALSIDAAGAAGLIAIDTRDAAEVVTMSKKLTVTGTLAAVAAATVGTTLGVTGVTTLTEELITAKNVGAGETGFVATEYGNGRQHVTSIAVNSTFGAIAGGAGLGLGLKAYTLPAGACIIKNAYFSVGITQSQGNINADTPEVGLGTVVASGVVVVLNGTTEFDDISVEKTAANCTGTATVQGVADQILVIATGDAHTVFLNIADDWAASGDSAATVVGTIVIEWTFQA